MNSAPETSAKFDQAYRLPLTAWGDVRIPPEIKRLAREGTPRSALELGCGIGRFTRYMALHGLQATGVDFSPVAIAKAKARVAGDDLHPEFLVEDVTRLTSLTQPFDVSFDVGCFHCLDVAGQRAYVQQVGRLVKPGGTHLIWALDDSPSDLKTSPQVVEAVFAPTFELRSAETSRRRLVASHWYWLTRK